MVDLHHFLQHRLRSGSDNRQWGESAARCHQAVDHDAFNQIGGDVQTQNTLPCGGDAIAAAPQPAAVQVMRIVLYPLLFLQFVEDFADRRNRQLRKPRQRRLAGNLFPIQQRAQHPFIKIAHPLIVQTLQGHSLNPV